MKPVFTGSISVATLLLVSCGSHGNNNEEQADTLTESAARNFADKMTGKAPKPVPVGQDFAVSDKTDLLEFSYTYPGQAAAIPELAAKFQQDLKRSKAGAVALAKEDQQAAKSSNFPFRGHSEQVKWTVKADTPRFLALESQRYSFTGGAHGMTSYGTALWDRARNRLSDVKMLMTKEQPFKTAILDNFCTALDKARAEKRGAPVVRGTDPFTQCVDPMKQVLIPTSKDGKLIDGFSVVIGPYEAGPYVEGEYDIALPVDKAMYDVIKTEYQDAFVKP